MTFDREKADGWLEKSILLLVLAVLVYGPLATGAVLVYDFLILQSLTILAAVLWVARLWLGAQRRLLWPPLCWGVLAFSAYAIARHSQADIEYVSRQEIIRVIVYALFFFVILQNLHRQNHAQIVAVVLVFLAMAIALYAIYQFATDSRYVWNYVKPASYAKRSSGTYICPNHLAGFLEMILPMAVSLTFLGKLNHVTRIFMGYGSLIILAGIVTTVSRGGWIASGTMLLCFILFLLRQRKYWLPAGVMITAVCLLALFFSKSERYQDRFHRVAEKKVDVRTLQWEPAFNMWRDHFWFGVGPAHFDERYREYRKEDFFLRPGRVHNDYLNTLTDWGLVGAALVSLAFALFYYGAVKSWKYVQKNSDFSTKQSNKPAILLGTSLGLVAILVHSFVDFNFHIPANAILAVSLMAFGCQYVRFASDRYWLPLNVGVRLCLSLACGAGVFYLGRQGWTRFQETALLKRAAAKPEYSMPRNEILKAAFNMEPSNALTAREIGEACRRRSWQGDADYAAWALEAIRWFDISIRLNPCDPISRMRCGMCLDWLRRFDEAGPYFAAAGRLDPNGYYVNAHLGWHRVQMGDYAGAIPYLEKSWSIRFFDNPIAENYLRIARKRVEEAAAPAQK